jgi:hypothetical protein
LLTVFVCLLLSIVILLAISITTITIEEQKYQHQNFAYASASSSLIPDFNFAAVGDWECTSYTIDTVNNILDKKPELVLGLGDFHNGNLYHFDLDQDRSGLVLDAPLNAEDADNDIINNIATSADKQEENKLLLSKALFGKGFGAITDIEVGPDGYLYVVSIGLGEIFRIVPSTARSSFLLQ